LAAELEKRTGFETRATTLGHIQRGGTPSAFDRVLATRFGIAAIDAVSEGKTSTMVSLKGTEIELVDISIVTGDPKVVGDDLYRVAEAFFG
jgi:6-phosphofructokinase 1